MFTKTTIVLSAVLAFGVASAALAAEAPESKIGDRYPFLEQTYLPLDQAVQQRAGASAYAAVRRPVKPFTAAERALFDRNKGVTW